MFFRILFLLSLVLAFAVATTEYNEPFVLPKRLRTVKAWQLRAFRRSRRRLRRLQGDLENPGASSNCKVIRRRKTAALLTEVRKARACRYRGIGFKEYSRLRALCRDRSEIQSNIATYFKKCVRKRGRKKNCDKQKVAPLKRKLRAAFQACRTIGWKGDGRFERAGCRSIMDLKKELKDIDAIKCGKLSNRAEILQNIAKTKERNAYLLSLIKPIPSSRPRNTWE